MIMKYKGYIGKVTFDEKYKSFHGRVINIHKDILTFEGKTARELEKALKDTVEDYFRWCKQDKVKPEKPFSGKFNIRISPELHRAIVEKADGKDISLNKFVENALYHEIENV